MKPSRSEFHRINGIRYHVRIWGGEEASTPVSGDEGVAKELPTLFALHGWLDVSASFQFMVDAMRDRRRVIAPDWRGFGLSGRPAAGERYWFPDYLRDLDLLFDLYQPEEPVDLLGHSMGGNIACLYAGVRPERVRRLITVEGFGMPATASEEAPERYSKWLAQNRHLPAFRAYRSYDELATRLQKLDPRLDSGRAVWLAPHWGKQKSSGKVVFRADPRHKVFNPVLYRLEEAEVCWRRISAPVLWVEGAQSDYVRGMYGPESRAEIDRRKGCYRDLRTVGIDDAGHMIHHDQPAGLAAAVEGFLNLP